MRLDLERARVRLRRRDRRCSSRRTDTTTRRPYSIAVGARGRAARGLARAARRRRRRRRRRAPHLTLDSGARDRRRGTARHVHLSRRRPTSGASSSSPAAPASRRCARCCATRCRFRIATSGCSTARGRRTSSRSSASCARWPPRGDIELRQTVTRATDADWTGARGRLTRDALEELVHDPATLCFVCGPPALVDEMPTILQDLGIPRERIRIEEWRRSLKFEVSSLKFRLSTQLVGMTAASRPHAGDVRAPRGLELVTSCQGRVVAEVSLSRLAEPRAPTGHSRPMAWKPASTIRISPVTAREAGLEQEQRGVGDLAVDARAAAARDRDTPAGCSRTRRCPTAASVLIGPAEIALTRMFFGPRSAAR